uniref:5-hydroxytryptamine receptor 3A n=1 Tax=Oncorhynchus mykiss TaxID=8022 RepID=A0A8K9Y1H9_ONCMY
MRSSALWTALVLLLIQGTARACTGKKMHYLSAGYKKGVRPVRNWRNCTMVAIDLMVYSILSVGSRPPALSRIIVQYAEIVCSLCLPYDFEDVNQMSVPIANVWVPDILINEFVDVGKSQDIPYVYVTHYGLVRNYKPIQLVTACTLNIYNFPFDIQNCSLTFQSWLHTLNDFDLKLMRSAEELKVDKSVFMNQGEWELLHVLSKYKSFSLDNIDSYAEMKFNVSIYNIIIHYLLFIYPDILNMLVYCSFHGQNVFLPDICNEIWKCVQLLVNYCSIPNYCLFGSPLAFAEAAATLPRAHTHQKTSQVTNTDTLIDKDNWPWRRGQQGAGSGEPGGPARGHEISSIRGILEKKDKCRDIAKEWLLVGYVLDVLLFRVYLVAMLAYSITLGSLWSMCQYA